MLDDTVSDDNSAACVLLPEVLSRIFGFLPLVDRKSVRLVCRAWYGCCICADITKREKFTFRAESSIENATEVMLRSSYSMMNLEFQGLPVSDIPVSTWEECGKRIRKLALYACQWDEETISTIILRCENLTSFIITVDDKYNVWRQLPYSTRQLPYSTRLLTDVIKKEILRPNLLNLSIYIGNDEDGSIIRDIFVLHPRIKHLRVCTAPRASFRLDRWLNPDTWLEGLAYNAPRDGKWMKTLVGLRLKCLDTEIIYKSSMKDTIFKFFKFQRNLEVIRFGIKGIDKGGFKDLCFHILECCPDLREFRPDNSWPGMHIRNSEMQRFFTLISKLNFLSLPCIVNGSELLPWFSDSLSNPVQLNLTSLQSDCDPDFSAALIQRCSSLQHLFLADVLDTTLQMIFQYLPGLQTLVVKYAKQCTDFGFTGRDVHGNEIGYSIKRLQQLTYLELRNMTSDAVKKSVLEMHLPCLKFLSLSVDCFEQLSEEALREFASNLPKLTVLYVTTGCYELYTEKSIQFCQQLDNLNRVMFFWPLKLFPLVDSVEEEELIESVFIACHRLRYLRLADRRMYIRDPSTGRVLCKDGSVFKFPSGNIFEDHEIV